MTRLLAALLLATSLAGCPSGTPLTEEELLDPEACAECHEQHYTQWSGSMHAYAAEDPVFLAMNQRGQEETDGALGAFCINCHAPMAVALGLTEDGTNLDEVPDHLEGITCAFCHRVDGIGDEPFNNPLTLSDEDDLMRGGIEDPVRTRAHRSMHAPLQDREDRSSAQLCGRCHDVVTPAGVHLERTLVEWEESVFAQDGPSLPLTCGNCHMPGTDGPSTNDTSLPSRRVHDHSMPGVDVAITEFPQRAEQLALVQDELDSVLVGEVCVQPNAGIFSIEGWLENAGAGHAWPSGSGQDRRVWLEVVAYDAAGAEVFSSGVVADDQPVTELADPWLWVLRDVMTNAKGAEVHMFWEAADVSSNLLPAAPTLDPAFFHGLPFEYPAVVSLPARVELRVLMRPMALEVLQSLVDTGHLDGALLAEFPTYEVWSRTWEGQLGECIN